MRHLRKEKKFGRSPEHRIALMSALVSGLIERKRIITTLPKAKQARISAEKLVTKGKKGTLAARRLVIAELRNTEVVKMFYTDIVPQFAARNGGYTRIIKMGRRRSDGSEMAILEWVGIARPERKKKEEKKKTAK